MERVGEYRLLDFGGGRKLESVAGRLVDRPSPAALETARRLSTKRWASAESRFCEHSKKWNHRRPWPPDLAVRCGTFVMPASPTPAGHLGVFPEQVENWKWLGEMPATGSPAALNLFGYTGASTMALAMAGFAVAHVDASRPSVEAAKVAAMLNQCEDAPIRYLVDDAVTFVRRELRRDRKYHTIVLDPPAYGHGPKGRAWRIERDVWPLLKDCCELLRRDAFRILVTETDVARFLRDLSVQFGWRGQTEICSGRSEIVDDSGRSLDAGWFVRCWSDVRSGDSGPT